MEAGGSCNNPHEKYWWLEVEWYGRTGEKLLDSRSVKLETMVFAPVRTIDLDVEFHRKKSGSGA